MDMQQPTNRIGRSPHQLEGGAGEPLMRLMLIHRSFGNQASLNESLATGGPLPALAQGLHGAQPSLTAVARAYDLIVGLQIIRVDTHGAGSVRGVKAWCTAPGSPDRMVTIQDERAAMWLRRHFDAKGLQVRLQWVN